MLRRLGFTIKQAQSFMRSPDPEYHSKWQAILAGYTEAIAQPDEVVCLFQDEFTYYRKAEVRAQWQTLELPAARVWRDRGNNTQARIAAALDGITGQVTFLQRKRIGKAELALFYQQL